MIAKHELTGMILAGGEGRRMGGRDKGLEPFAGLPLVAHTVKRFEGQVHELVINANRNSDAYALFADRVIEDAEGGFKGPLMGIYSGLRAAQTPWLLVAPCDSPCAAPRFGGAHGRRYYPGGCRARYRRGVRWRAPAPRRRAAAYVAG
ncbi:hypothetical protein HAALTHF_16430n [Vreelandella aquamarina]|nr:hypothetical protein HAALTHF_16430n [Halomonas axialensis]